MLAIKFSVARTAGFLSVISKKRERVDAEGRRELVALVYLQWGQFDRVISDGC